MNRWKIIWKLLLADNRAYIALYHDSRPQSCHLSWGIYSSKEEAAKHCHKADAFLEIDLSGLEAL